MSAESLRMLLSLEVDETLHTNYTLYQSASESTATISFPSDIYMFPWNDIEQLREYIYEQTHIQCIHQRLFFRGREITAYRRRKRNNNKTAPSLSFFGITDGAIIYLQCASASDSSPIVLYGNNNKTGDKSLIKSCIDGFACEFEAILSEDGEGGTYFLRDGDNKRVACFKPCDEEAGCINNPRGRISTEYATSQAINCGIKPSEGHLREIAAYLFDCANGHFHDVPITMRVEIDYKQNWPTNKIGSLQSFIAGEVIENFGVKNFAIRQVHKIGILDILLLNSDRNSGNVLVFVDEFGRYSLTPIDHGLSLPKCIEITTDSWVWLKWKQSKEPFDPYTIDYINRIDIDRNIALLCAELNLESIVFENMRISHLVLKKGTMRGLTLNEIGSIIARPDFDTKSILEELMLQAESLAIEKVRQNKHLCNRIKLKKFKQKQKEKHIIHKFIEKGVEVKVPKILRAANPNKMQVIKSKNKINTKHLTVNTKRNKNNNILNNIALGSLTPEPFSYEQNNENDTKPFWTPNYKAVSSTNTTANTSKTESPKTTQKEPRNKDKLPFLFLEEEEHKMKQVQIMPPLIQKTSSIHDRDADESDDDNNINNNNNNNNNKLYNIKSAPHQMTIFKSIESNQFFSDFNIGSNDNIFADDYEDENGLVPLSRSASCITSKSGSKSAQASAASSIATSWDIKSASLINHSSMMEKRREIMAAKLNANRLNHQIAQHKIDDIDEEETETTSIEKKTAIEKKNAIEATRSFSSISRTPILSALNNNNNNNDNSPSAASHQSQDDMIRDTSNKVHTEFGIHPIMQRMAKENYEVNKYFMHYLDQLLGIQCLRISNRSRKSDKHDSIYDIDTVEGSFIWKNELRKHWIRSRLERKKLMQPKPPRNPFHDEIKLSNGHLVKHQKHNDNKQTSAQQKQSNPHKYVQQQQTQQIQNSNNSKEDAAQSVSETESTQSEDDGHDWFGAECTVDYDDDSLSYSSSSSS